MPSSTSHIYRQAQMFAPLTPPQQLTFDLAESRRRRDSGQAQALWSAEPWRVRAERWLKARTEPFTSEALVADVGLPTGAVKANRNNSVGALISNWSRRKLIRRVGYAPSRRVESHGALLSVWEPTGKKQVA